MCRNGLKAAISKGTHDRRNEDECSLGQLPNGEGPPATRIAASSRNRHQARSSKRGSFFRDSLDQDVQPCRESGPVVLRFEKGPDCDHFRIVDADDLVGH